MGSNPFPLASIGPSCVYPIGRIPSSETLLHLPNMIQCASLPFPLPLPAVACRSHCFCAQRPMISSSNSSLLSKLMLPYWVPRAYKKSMDAVTPWQIEAVFLLSSSLSILGRAFAIAPLLAFIYLLFVLAYAIGCFKLRQPDPIMFHSPLSVFNLFIFCTLQLSRFSNAQNAISSTTSYPGTPTSFRPIYTLPSSADVGATVIPNIDDPQAKDAQDVCPGYTAANVARNPLGLTATLTLAGSACNVYGNDIDTLNLTVQYQSADRLAIRITPAVIDASNSSYYDLPSYIVHQPTPDADANSTSLSSDLSFVWSNDPTFSFSVYRVSTGDTLFTTVGTKLVFEDQFVEFASALPENYNLYGLGESIHALRLGNNFTKTIYAVDSGDTIDT